MTEFKFARYRRRDLMLMAECVRVGATSWADAMRKSRKLYPDGDYEYLHVPMPLVSEADRRTLNVPPEEGKTMSKENGGEMSKRPPEMVELVRAKVLGGSRSTRAGYVFPAFEPVEVVGADEALAAIRSLRVKLFRERADMWAMRSVSALCCDGDGMDRCIRRSERFSAIANAIERGEK